MEKVESDNEFYDRLNKVRDYLTSEERFQLVVLRRGKSLRSKVDCVDDLLLEHEVHRSFHEPIEPEALIEYEFCLQNNNSFFSKEMEVQYLEKCKEKVEEKVKKVVEKIS